MQKLFFYLREDLLPKLIEIEEKVKIKYLINEGYKQSQVEVFESLKELDQKFSLGHSKEGHWHDLQVFIVPKDEVVKTKKIHQYDGVIRTTLDLENLNFVELAPGGIYKEKYLISGRLAVVLRGKEDNIRKEMYQTIHKILFKSNIKCGVYAIGEKAAQAHLDENLILTPEYQTPKEYWISLDRKFEKARK